MALQIFGGGSGGTSAGSAKAVIDVPAFAGVAMSTFGHSYAAGSGSSVAAYGYVARLNRRLGTGSLNAQGVGGYQAADTASKIAATANAGNLCIWDSVINDALFYTATNNKSTNGFANGLRAFIDFALGGAKIEEGSASVVFTGTWATTAFAGASGGNIKTSSTLNDSFTVSFYGDKVTLMLIGRDDSANGTAGAAYSVTFGGSTVATGTLSNQMKQSGTTNYTLAHVPVRLSGFGPGYHTVTVTKTDATGSIIGFDCAVTPSTAPPTLVLVKAVQVIATQYLAANTYVPAFNAVIDAELAASFVSGKRIVAVDPSALPDWSASTALYQDGLHPSDIGHNLFATAILNALVSYGYLYGQNSKTWADFLAGTPAPASPSDTFTRADSTTSMGATTTGAVPWSVETPNAAWGISGNKGAPMSSINGSVVAAETGRADGTFTYTFSVVDGGNTGIVFRLAPGAPGSAASYWLWAGAVMWYYNGSSLASQTAATGALTTFAAGDTVTIVLSGNTITCKKNGATIATYSGGANTTATKAGFWSQGSTATRISSFSATA